MAERSSSVPLLYSAVSANESASIRFISAIAGGKKTPIIFHICLNPDVTPEVEAQHLSFAKINWSICSSFKINLQNCPHRIGSKSDQPLKFIEFRFPQLIL